MVIPNTLKRGQYSKTFFLILITLDALCIYSAYHFSFWSSFGYVIALPGHYLSLGAIWILLWIVVALFVRNYETEYLKYVDKIVLSTVKLSVIHVCLLFIYLFFTHYYYSIFFIVATYLFTAALAIGTKVLLLFAYRYVRNRKVNTISYIIVGYTPAGRNIFRFLKKNQKFGYRFMGFFDDQHSGSLVRGGIDSIREYCIEHDVKEIYFALPDKSSFLSDLAQFADEHFIHFGLVQEVSGTKYQRLSSQVYDNIPVISYEAEEKISLIPNYRRAFLRLLKQ